MPELSWPSTKRKIEQELRDLRIFTQTRPWWTEELERYLKEHPEQAAKLGALEELATITPWGGPTAVAGILKFRFPTIRFGRAKEPEMTSADADRILEEAKRIIKEIDARHNAPAEAEKAKRAVSILAKPHAPSPPPARVRSPNDVIREDSGYLDPRGGFDEMIQHYGDFAIVVKDTNGFRAMMNMRDYIALQKNPYFLDRVRQIWIAPAPGYRDIRYYNPLPPIRKPDVQKGFMHTLGESRWLGMRALALPPPSEAVVGAVRELGGIRLVSEASVTPMQQLKFADMLLNPDIRALLKESGIKELRIEPPARHVLSGQGALYGNDIISLNADAIEPASTLLHELGHLEFKRLPMVTQAELIERVKQAESLRHAGYVKTSAYEEAVAEYMYKDPSVFPEYASKVRGVKSLYRGETDVPGPPLETVPLERILESLRRGEVPEQPPQLGRRPITKSQSGWGATRQFSIRQQLEKELRDIQTFAQTRPPGAAELERYLEEHPEAAANIRGMEELAPILPMGAATAMPSLLPRVSAATVELQKKLPKIWKTVIGTELGLAGAGVVTTAIAPKKPEEKPAEDKSTLWKILDTLNTISYLQGAAIKTMGTIKEAPLEPGKWLAYGYEEQVFPSEALGITTKETPLLSWQTAVGLLTDIGLDPSTYLTFGAGGAVKIGARGGERIALSPEGIRVLKAFKQKYGKEGEAIFATLLEDPAHLKKYEAAKGIVLRGWGPFMPGLEAELVSKEALRKITAVSGGAWEESLRKLALSGDVGLGAAVRLKAAETRTLETLEKTRETIGKAFTPFYEIKKLPRPLTLAPREPEYPEKYLRYTKTVRYQAAEAVREAEKLAKRAEKEFGPEYQEITARYLEAPVLREQAQLTEEANAILETIDAYHKAFAEAEKARGLLTHEVPGYVAHRLTPEAREYLRKGGKITPEIYKPAVETPFAKERTYKGTIEGINKKARQELGIDFDLFIADPFAALAIRWTEHVKAKETYDFLEWVATHYGKVTPETLEGLTYTRIPQLKGVALPKVIARHLEPEYIGKEAPSAIGAYDWALKWWKTAQTVPFPGYHVLNILGGIFTGGYLAGTRPGPAREAFEILTRKELGKPQTGKIYTTALGEKYTADELLKMAGELGVMGQPGMMDIPEQVAFRESKTLTDRIKKAWQTISPTTTARREENWMRFSMFIDRLMKGDIPEDAASWTARHMFEYLPVGKTPFEQEYAKRLIPFYTWLRGNIPLQTQYLLTQPGKYLAFAETMQTMMQGLTPPSWAAGALTVPTGAGYFSYFRTPVSDLEYIVHALTTAPAAARGEYEPLRAMLAPLTPAVKIPIELLTGRSLFTGEEYESRWEAITRNLIGRPITTYEQLTAPRPAEEKFLRAGLGIGRAKTLTRKELEEQFRGAAKRPEAFTWEQRFAGYLLDYGVSPYSGIGEYLQAGHILSVEEGGRAEIYNIITQTMEENLEWAAAQRYRMGLPEKLWKEEEAWQDLETGFKTRLEETKVKTREKLEEQGELMSTAYQEQTEYETQKAKNIQLFSRQLAKVRTQLNWAKRRWFREQENLKRKTEKGYDDPGSKLQIRLLEKLIPDYERQYYTISRMREEERAKEFELPAQIIPGERYAAAMLGRGREIVIRGKGPTLTPEEHIKSLVDENQYAIDRSIVQLEAAVVGFPLFIPEAVRKRVQLPIAPEWAERQRQAEERLVEILGEKEYKETWVPVEYAPLGLAALGGPEAIKELEAGRAELKARIAIGAGAYPKWIQELAEEAFKPEAEAKAKPKPRAWPEAFGFPPAPTLPEAEEPLKPACDLDALLESDEFVAAVESIVIATLDRGLER